MGRGDGLNWEPLCPVLAGGHQTAHHTHAHTQTTSNSNPPTSRASALVMLRSVAARALTRLASSVGLTPGALVSSAV